MNIVIPLAGRVRMCIRSSYVLAKRVDATHYDLSGEAFRLASVTNEQVCVFDDSIQVAENDELTAELKAKALPFERFVRATAEEALRNALGLLLRLAVADGRISDAELLTVQPVLEGRLWQPGIDVQVGDVYTFGSVLWRCIQAHTTQGDWAPDLTPSLWRKVEIIPENAVRVWAAGIDYIVGDEVAYPDENSPVFTCLQAHSSQDGWEPPNVPALWKEKAAAEPVILEEIELSTDA